LPPQKEFINEKIILLFYRIVVAGRYPLLFGITDYHRLTRVAVSEKGKD